MSHPTFSWTLLSDTVPAAPSSGAGTFTPGIDFLLDNDGDLFVDSDAHFTTGIESVAQGIRIRMQLFRGEWFADLDAGVPYYQDLLGQKFSKIKALDAFRDAILDTPNVDSIRKLDVEFDAGTRELSINWEVKSTYGIIVDEVEL